MFIIIRNGSTSPPAAGLACFWWCQNRLWTQEKDINDNSFNLTECYSILLLKTQKTVRQSLRCSRVPHHIQNSITYQQPFKCTSTLIYFLLNHLTGKVTIKQKYKIKSVLPLKGTDAWIHTRVNDSQRAHPVVFATGCAELNVVSAVMMDSGFGQHSVVLNLRFPGNTH